jgi:DNA-binding SARP family transcriptional activator/tetratricopeptide (TPR) repeat protein
VRESLRTSRQPKYRYGVSASGRSAASSRAGDSGTLVARPMPLGVSIRLLGPVEILVEGHPLAVDTRKAVALLAYLAVTAQPASRERLAALLWPESSDPDSRSALRRTLSVLRSALGPARLTIDRQRVELVDSGVAIDLRAFRERVQEARRHGHPPDQACAPCVGVLEQAQLLDRGEFMAGFSLRDSEAWDDWHRGEAEAVARERSAALERLTRGLAAAGRWDGAVRVARRWLEVDPLHEPAHRLLIEAHGRAGEPAAAIGQYRACSRILAAELGVRPLPETTATYEAVRDGVIAPEPAPPPATAPPPPPATVSPPEMPVVANPVAANPGRLPIVGRDPELARLAGVLASSRSTVVVVIGEAGIGKTRLIDALGEHVLAAGGSVLSARAWSGEQGLAFGPIVGLLCSALGRASAQDWLARLDPTTCWVIGRLTGARLEGSTGVQPGFGIVSADGPSDRLRVLEGIADALAASGPTRSTGLVRVDDLQWADASTLEALAYLGRRLDDRRPDDRRLILALSWRPEDVGATEAQLRTIEQMPDSVVIRPGRLDRPAIDELVRAAGAHHLGADAVDLLAAESEGLPLHLVEALAIGDRPSGTMPPGIRALLEQRLAAVSEVAGQMLAAAAVVGRSFDPDLVRRASGRSEEETVTGLEELVRRRLIREAPIEPGRQPYDFAHSRVRDLAYERISLARRRLLHGRVAAAIRTTGEPVDELARTSLLAEHERAAGRPGAAAEAYVRAAELARAVQANAEALAALEAAQSLGHPDTLGLEEAIGAVRTRLGDYPGALAALETAAAIAPPDRLAAIERRLGWIQFRRGDLAAAESHLAAALATLGPDASPSRRSEIQADRSVVAHRAGDEPAALALAGMALDMIDPAVHPGAAAVAHRLLGLVAHAQGSLDGARAELSQSLVLAGQANDLDAAIAAEHALSRADLAGDDAWAALGHARTALEGTTRSGDRHVEAAVENTMADILHALGRETESRDHQRRAVSLFAAVGGAAASLDAEIWKLVEW